jgi:hypothetical protein
LLQRLALTLPENVRLTLHDEILHRAQTEPSYTRTHAVGAWRSTGNLLDWPVAAALRSALVRLLQDDAQLPIDLKTLSAWAIVSRRGAFHRRHVHSVGYAWSGVYYVSPSDPSSARTVFEIDGEMTYVTPEVGLTVIFPANTWHAVEEHRSDVARVTIAFNVGAV